MRHKNVLRKSSLGKRRANAEFRARSEPGIFEKQEGGLLPDSFDQEIRIRSEN